MIKTEDLAEECFNVGDRVYMVKKGIIIGGKINCISIIIRKADNFIKYNIDGVSEQIDKENIYESAEAVVKFLLGNIDEKD